MEAVAAFKREAALEKRRESDRAYLDEMTPERLARQAEIAKLPDAKHITEDQMNYHAMAIEASQQGDI